MEGACGLRARVRAGSPTGGGEATRAIDAWGVVLTAEGFLRIGWVVGGAARNPRLKEGGRMLEFFHTPLGMTLVSVAPVVLLALVLCWLSARDTRRILRRWEVEDQLRELAAQIYEERLPAEEQERRRQFR